jgi:hypothetical protein
MKSVYKTEGFMGHFFTFLYKSDVSYILVHTTREQYHDIILTYGQQFSL